MRKITALILLVLLLAACAPGSHPHPGCSHRAASAAAHQYPITAHSHRYSNSYTALTDARAGGTGDQRAGRQ